MKYSHFEIQTMLDRLVIIADTREQDTPLFRKRFEGLKCPLERLKLNYGDYSAYTVSDAGERVSLAESVCVERKMNIDEICSCFTKGRERFEREFKRAKSDNASVYLLIETATWENIINGRYKSKLNPDALTASILAWQARYNLRTIFCKAETTGKLIYKILYYEMKERLQNAE